MQTTIALRLARPDDRRALRRLAVLDEAPPPDDGLHLLAVADGDLIAAIFLERDWHAADPFTRSAAALELLRHRREQLCGHATHLRARGLVKRVRAGAAAG